MKNKLGVIRITISKNVKLRGEISVLMVGFESPGIELPWRRSALSECSCYILNSLTTFPLVIVTVLIFVFLQVTEIGIFGMLNITIYGICF